MGIGDSMTLVACLAGTMVALPALLVFLNLVMGSMTYNAAHRLHKGVITPLIFGVIAIALVAFPASALISLGSLPQLIGTLLYLFLLTWGFTGMAAFARMLGGRLGLLAEAEHSHLTETLIGTAVLSFAVAFPLIGWLVVLPLSFVMGIGATIVGRSAPAEMATES